jgi:hypothetical protein
MSEIAPVHGLAIIRLKTGTIHQVFGIADSGNIFTSEV